MYNNPSRSTSDIDLSNLCCLVRWPFLTFDLGRGKVTIEGTPWWNSIHTETDNNGVFQLGKRYVTCSRVNFSYTPFQLHTDLPFEFGGHVLYAILWTVVQRKGRWPRYNGPKVFILLCYTYRSALWVIRHCDTLKHYKTTISRTLYATSKLNPYYCVSMWHCTRSGQLQARKCAHFKSK